MYNLTQLALQSLRSSNFQDIASAACGRLIQLCTDHRLVSRGKQLHSLLILSSVPLDNFLISKLISFYSKTNNLHYARKVFDEITHKNIFTWNAMFIGYSNHNHHTDTLNLFSSLIASGFTVRPDGFTITSVLKALSSVRVDLNLAKMMHCLAVSNGFDSDIFVANAMITYYCRCDDVAAARAIFDRMFAKDLVSWNSMLAGYSQGGCYEDCKMLYGLMLGSPEGVRPDGVTVVSVLQACAQSNDIVLGMEVHNLVIGEGIEMDLAVCNSLITLYAKCGSLDYARELFDEMSEKDEVTYGAIIHGYMSYGFVDDAINLFQEMKSPGLSTWNAVISGLIQNNRHEGVVHLFKRMQSFGLGPNPVTLSSILPVLSYLSNLRGGKEIHAYAIKNSFDNNIFVSTALIDNYAKLGFLHGAQRVFDQSKYRSVILWTSIISAYSAHGDVDSTLSLFANMLNDGIQPDAVTFTAVLSACAHSGLVDEAWRIFNSMHSEHGIKPLSEHYSCIVGVLSRAGKLCEAAEFIYKMPIEPSAKTWGALLQGAAVCGDVEIGKFVCDRLFKLEPENTGNYIIMANLYSKAGRWDEAEKVREMMNGIGLKKIPGSSWIGTPEAEGLQRFIASNEKTEEMHHVYEKVFFN